MANNHDLAIVSSLDLFAGLLNFPTRLWLLRRRLTVREKGYLTSILLNILSLFSIISMVFLLLGGIGLPGGAVYTKDAYRIHCG